MVVSTLRLLRTDQGIILDIYVKPDSREFKVKVENDEFVVFCTEAPVKGRVNKELMKELSRFFRKRVEIASGFTSKQKRILIRDMNLDELNGIISELQQTSRR